MQGQAGPQGRAVLHGHPSLRELEDPRRPLGVFYDPVERIATRHADHTYEEIVFDPWQQATWDANGGVSDRGDC
jgi:hypothetical protein